MKSIGMFVWDLPCALTEKKKPRGLAAANAAPAVKQPQIMVAERKPAKKVVVVRRGNLPEERYTVAAYAPEQPRFFGPFRFPF